MTDQAVLLLRNQLRGAPREMWSLSLSLSLSLFCLSLCLSCFLFSHALLARVCLSLSLFLSEKELEDDETRVNFFLFLCVWWARARKRRWDVFSLVFLFLQTRFNPKPNRGFLCRVSGRFQRLAMASDHHGPSGYVVRGRFLHGDDDVSERLPEQTAGREV